MSRSVFVLSLAVAILCLLATVQAGFFEDEVMRVKKYNAANYLERLAKEKDIGTLPSGVLFKYIRRGFGDVAPAVDDVCDVHYTVRFRFPKVVEDTRTYPYPVRRSPSQLIAGVQEAMQYMREGDRMELYVPFQLAYGPDGDEKAGIPPYTNLRYDFEVVRCNEPHGRTSEEIDAFLQPLLKTPIPSKTAEINYADL